MATSLKLPPLYTAVQKGCEKFVSEYVENHIDVEDEFNGKYCNGRGPLHLAANNNIYKVIPLLIKHPLLDVNQRDFLGCTPFIYACSNNAVDSVRELLKCEKLDTNLCCAKDEKTGPSPFELAVRAGYVNVIKEWIASGRGLPDEINRWEIKVSAQWVEEARALGAEMRKFFSSDASESDVVAMCELLGDYLKNAEETKLMISLELKTKIVVEEKK
jgi:hypothetical protein